MTDFLIKKTTGEKEPFQRQKIIKSLQAIGADDKTIDTILTSIEQEHPRIKNTQQIFSIAKAMLKKINPALASRYNLKQALFAFGPAGYPFERYVSALLQAEGYAVQTNQTLNGYCIEHEIDVLIYKHDHTGIVECKFHNRAQYKSDVKVPLYVHARLADLQKNKSLQIDNAWVVTNTIFTKEAIKYAACEKMHLISWGYPKGYSLKELITKHNLHPITALVNLTGRQKKLLLKEGIVLCRDIHTHEGVLKQLGLPKKEVAQLIKDAQATCLLKAITK